MTNKSKWRPTEPAREAIYQKLYERIATQDSCITWLLVELRALQKRVNQLETWHARLVTENGIGVGSTDPATSPRTDEAAR